MQIFFFVYQHFDCSKRTGSSWDWNFGASKHDKLVFVVSFSSAQEPIDATSWSRLLCAHSVMNVYTLVV